MQREQRKWSQIKCSFKNQTGQGNSLRQKKRSNSLKDKIYQMNPRENKSSKEACIC